MSKLIGSYKNGNYEVSIYDDGTKIRQTNEKDFIPSFAENCDVKITDRCDGSCPMCYEGCSRHGKHADLRHTMLNFNSLHPYTEFAINGNDLSHPELIWFLEELKEHKVITNITINQTHFEKYYHVLKGLQVSELIHGIGISLRTANESFIDRVNSLPNTVVHVINGIVTQESIEKMSGKGLKMLILGYKKRKRGIDYYKENEETILKNMTYLNDNLEEIIRRFKVVSFDNLAIEQLNVKRLMDENQWKQFYMGDDGAFTFYLDLVRGEYAKDSMSDKRYPMERNIDDMFHKIQAENRIK